jgi:hypothetical protein
MDGTFSSYGEERERERERERGDMQTQFVSENLKGRHRSEELGVDGRIILKWILGKYGGKVCTGCTWLRIGTSGGLL